MNQKANYLFLKQWEGLKIKKNNKIFFKHHKIHLKFKKLVKIISLQTIPLIQLLSLHKIIQVIIKILINYYSLPRNFQIFKIPNKIKASNKHKFIISFKQYQCIQKEMKQQQLQLLYIMRIIIIRYQMNSQKLIRKLNNSNYSKIKLKTRI